MHSPFALPAAPAIAWQEPVINDPAWALDDACAQVEQLAALLKNNTADLYGTLIDVPSKLDEATQRHTYSIALVYSLGSERAAELYRLLALISEGLCPQPQTGVGKHVERARRGEWIIAVSDHRAADALALAANGEDAAACAAAEAAFDRMVKTRSPDLRALHEKMCAVRTFGGFHTSGVIDALFSDVEALVHLYERTGQPAAQAEG